MTSGELGAQRPAAKKVLVVANRTAATPALVEKVRARAGEGDCTFTLLAPQLPGLVDREAAVVTLELAIPLLQEAAGGPVQGLLGPSDAFEAVSRVLVRDRFDEVIISTLPARVSKWLGIDLPSRVEKLGVPVSVVTARETTSPIEPRFAGP